MGARRRAMITRWLRWVHGLPRGSYRLVPYDISSPGIDYHQNYIEATRGNGTIIRRLWRGPSPEASIWQMPLPNQVTWFRWMDTYRAFTSAGISVICVPRGVLERADLIENTIEVLDSEKRVRFARPPHQVIRATVSPWTSRRTREALFLSGYDLGERGLSYFLCELPPDAKVTTVEEAYRALQPESVKRALSQGRKVLRQGDMFFIRVVDEEPPTAPTVMEKYRLFSTNHYAEEGGHRGGMTFVRGQVRHNPSGRRPDHRALRLPRGWWIAVRNTVPVVT